MPVDLNQFRTKAAAPAAPNPTPRNGVNTLVPGGTPRGFLRGYNGTDKFEYGNYFNLGTYNCRIKKNIHKPKSQKSGVPLYIVEFDILEVLDTKVGMDRSNFKNPDGSLQLQNAADKVGDTRSMAQSLKDDKIAAPVLSAFAQAVGNPQDQEERQVIIDNFEEILELACGDDQPMKGDTCQVDAVPHKTQKGEWIIRLLFKAWAPEGTVEG